MDNYTLLIILDIVLAILFLFTYVTTAKQKNRVGRLGRLSSADLFLGFLLITLQGRIPSFLSVVLSNYLLFTGFYLQVATALLFIKGVLSPKPSQYVILTALYLIFFPVFTYLRPDTTMRIIIISALLGYTFGTGAFLLSRHYGGSKREKRKSAELFYLFLAASAFYVLRLILTLSGLGRVKTLLAPNLVTTLSLLFVLTACLTFILGMLITILREESRRVLMEKQKSDYLFNFLSETAGHLELRELYGSIETILRKSFGVGSAAIFLKNEEGTEHCIAHKFNELNLPLDGVTCIRKGEGASGKAIEEDRVVEVDIEDYPNPVIADSYKKLGVSKLYSFPLKSPKGIIGAITMAFTRDGTNAMLDRTFLYHLGEQIGMVLHNALMYRSMNEMAHRDPLTGLLNRRRMIEILEAEKKRADRTGLAFTLGMADLDNFKDINDTRGHDCGDQVLRNAALFFIRECRDTDQISRWGGEEFLFLFLDNDLEEARNTADRLKRNFPGEAFPCLGAARPTFSMGLAGYDQDLTVEQIISQADKRLYKAKSNGKNRVEWED